MAKRAYKWVWNARIEKESLVDLHRFRKALNFYRLQRGYVEQATNLAISEVRDQQAPGGLAAT